MMQQYKKIEIFTSEEARWQGQPLHDAVVRAVHDLKIAARCLVTRGIEGSYESGEIATGRLEVLSYNMPVRVTIVLPSSEFERVAAKVETLVTDGIVAVQDLPVLSHKTRGLLLPKHARVRDIMTANPQRVELQTSLAEVARLLLSSTFTGLPVVDAHNRPVGVIAQGDLIYQAGMPMRLGLLAESDQQKVSAVLEALRPRQAREVMTTPPVIVRQDSLVTAAVDLMLKKGVKRLPVVDETGRLVGILSRVDVFHTSLRECPDWRAFQRQAIAVDLRSVADIMRRDAVTVLPETPIEEVIRLIDSNHIQRVCVVDRAGHFLGLISDRDLLIAFSERHPGIWDYFVSKIPFTEKGKKHRQLQQFLLGMKTAGECMNPNIVTVREDAPVNEALRLMLAKGIKRLPVIDAEGKYQGLVSRDSLLRAGFASASTPSS